MSLALIVIVVMGGLVAGIAAYWPGIMIDDARWQYQQSVDNSYEDWHPVLMALVWHALMMVRTGPAPMLILQLALYWSGVALIAGWLWRRGAHGIGLAVACLGWMPAAFALMGSVTKDCLMAGVLLSATGLLLWRDEASAARRLAVSVAAFALLLVASALRVNAFLATAPLALLLLPRLFTSSKLRKALSGLVLAAAFLCIPAAFARLAGAEQTNSDLSLIIFDLGGITEHSAQSQFPPLGVTSAVAANHHCYDPVEWDSYSSWARTPCPLGFEAIEPLVDNGDFDPVPAWRDAILSHPVAYAQHRLDHFNRSTWFMVQAGPDFTAWSQSVANPWNFQNPAQPHGDGHDEGDQRRGQDPFWLADLLDRRSAGHIDPFLVDESVCGGDRSRRIGLPVRNGVFGRRRRDWHALLSLDHRRGGFVGVSGDGRSAAGEAGEWFCFWPRRGDRDRADRACGGGADRRVARADGRAPDFLRSVGPAPQAVRARAGAVRASEHPDPGGLVRDDSRGPRGEPAAGRARAWGGAAAAAIEPPRAHQPAGELAIGRLLGTQPPSPRKVGARRAAAVATALSKPLRVGFYTPWDPSSVASLQRHIGELDWLAPVWFTVNGPNHEFAALPDRDGRAIINSTPHRPLILPVVQNFNNGQVDSAGAASLMAAPRATPPVPGQARAAARRQSRRRRVVRLRRSRSCRAGQLPRLAARGASALRASRLDRVRGRSVDQSWDLRRFALVADKLFLMAYDEHSNDGPAGPIASQRWWASAVAAAVRQVPRSKVVVTIGNYAYDWHDKGGDPESVEEAWVDAGDSETRPGFDRASANSMFAYDDENGVPHTVWMLDAASAFNELTVLDRAGLREVALWRMGAEDPGLWSIFGRSAAPSPPRAAGLVNLAEGTNVDIEGQGEILRITALPTPGERRLQFAPNGLIADVDFAQVPRPYTITRTGDRPGLIALTFDDGPDERWTPKILDILKARQVRATFFIVGENALTERGLLERMIREGHEVGSHTYTHPNLAAADRTRTLFELNATQRLFEAFTGRTLKLFRAPFFGDAEPTTADEILPVSEAQNRGLHFGRAACRQRGLAAARRARHRQQRALAGHWRAKCTDQSDAQCSRNVVLLHDSGGDRSQTVAALPILIDALRARGYTFVPVSELAGLSPSQAMPPLSSADHLAARIDLGLFELVGFAIRALGFLFAAAISLGIARALVLSALALLSGWKDLRRKRPPIRPDTFVSVLIPAFNEEQVIERSVSHVLASTNVRLEVIVIDDGSKDRTSEIVREAFRDDERVQLITLANGGKARALNHGLEVAKSEIVIALDADTQFEPDTIARLARWLVADEGLAAVAGNAKVGNRVNLVTKWQALEYVTAQNLERRALARLGAMTVVPGAVGVWRKKAIAEVGGYPPETLAEDQDLTIAVQRAGWRVAYDQSAIAWTEAPGTFHQLARQRFRWAFGTIQCAWKHKGIMKSGKPRGLALIGLPQTIMFQLLFALVSPIIDLALVINIFSTFSSLHEHGFTAVKGDLPASRCSGRSSPRSTLPPA